MGSCCSYLKSSIGKKQVVAVTGLMLILFLVGHLAGNLFVFMGPEAFNKYAEKLANMRPGLYLIEASLAYIFCVHMWFTFCLVHDNIKSRPIKYAVYQSSEKRSLATKLMPFTGVIILSFIVWHLLDFTFTDHHGSRNFLNGKDYGIYGMVVNSFRNPIHSILYVVSMIALGFHLSHAVQSVAQTFGSGKLGAGRIQKISNMVGIFIGGAFSSIPIYILFNNIGKVACCPGH